MTTSIPLHIEFIADADSALKKRETTLIHEYKSVLIAGHFSIFRQFFPHFIECFLTDDMFDAASVLFRECGVKLQSTD